MEHSLDAGGGSTRQPLRGGVTPYLMLEGAADAIGLYARAFGATEVGPRALMSDGRILNSRIDMNGASVMLMDPMPEHGHPAAPHDGFTLHLQVDDADASFQRAVEAGCEVVMPVELQFWGDRYGMVKDRFGVRWSLGSTPAPSA